MNPPVPLELPVSRAPSYADCVRCGLCLESCPTYSETAAEAESPRGRIAIMKALEQGRLDVSRESLVHLDRCLDCRACETACPSGVRYGALIEATRSRYADAPRGPKRLTGRLLDYFILRVLPNPRRLRRWLRAARLAEAVGLLDYLENSGALRRLGIPRIPIRPARPSSFRATASRPRPARPDQQPAALFLGCVNDVLSPQTHEATIRVLQRHGYAVARPGGQTCCGAIHLHAGRVEEARQMARTNIEAFERAGGSVVVNVAGCGAMLREYGELLAADGRFASRAHNFSMRVRDVSELVAARALHGSLQRPLRVAVHDPCHLCHAQRIREAPRTMLRAINGITLVPLGESDTCCGAAGTYSLTQPDMSRRLAERKWRNIRAAAPEVVAAANIGCIVQLQQHAPQDLRHIRIVHPIELVDEAE